MRTRPQRALAPAVMGLALVLSSSLAGAQADSRARALSILQAVEAQIEHKKATEPLLTRARKSLERADAARRAGDHRRGALLEALALEQSETANDLIRVLKAEAEASELGKRALSAETRRTRAEALVEQTAARRGRAEAQLAAAEAEKAAAAQRVTKGRTLPAAKAPPRKTLKEPAQ